MQMRESKTNHQLLEEEQKLEQYLKRAAFEVNVVYSQSTSARDEPPFDGTQRRRMAWNRPAVSTTSKARSINSSLPELNRHALFSRYRNLSYRS